MYFCARSNKYFGTLLVLAIPTVGITFCLVLATLTMISSMRPVLMPSEQSDVVCQALKTLKT